MLQRPHTDTAAPCNKPSHPFHGAPEHIVIRPLHQALGPSAGGDYAEALFNCRAGVAQRQAEAACERLARDPPDPPFAQVTLNLRRYTAGHTPAPRPGAEAGGGVPRELPQSLTLAAEAEGDTVSASIKRKGALQPWAPSLHSTTAGRCVAERVTGEGQGRACAAHPPGLCFPTGSPLQPLRL